MEVREDGFPVHHISHEGTDCAKIIRDQPDRAREVVEGIVTAITGLLVRGTHEVGIDAFLSSFSLNGHGVRYVDIFPSYVKFDGQTSLHYPNPADSIIFACEEARKFTAFGILRRLRLDLMLLDPALESVFWPP